MCRSQIHTQQHNIHLAEYRAIHLGGREATPAQMFSTNKTGIKLPKHAGHLGKQARPERQPSGSRTPENRGGKSGADRLSCTHHRCP